MNNTNQTIIEKSADVGSNFIYKMTSFATTKLQDSGFLVSPIIIKLISIFFGGLLVYAGMKVTNKILKPSLIFLGLIIIFLILYKTFS